MWRFLAKVLFKIAYRIDVRSESLETALSEGGRVIVAPHYASFIDPVLFGLFLPGRPTVAVSPSLARQKWFGRVKGCFDHVVIDLNDAASLKRIDDLWKTTSLVVLFPEPEPTTNGLVMKLSDVAVAAIQNSKATVIAARASGTQFTPFSKVKERLTLLRFPKVTILCGEAGKISAETPGDTESRRRQAKLRLEVMMTDVMMESAWDKQPIFDTLLEQRALWGPKRVMAMEPDGSRIDWDGFIVRIFLVGRIIRKISKAGDMVGIMLPNSLMTLASIIGSQIEGRTPAMLNYSMGARSLKAACGVAKVGTMITSRRFVEEGKFAPLVSALSDAGVAPFYLEDEVAAISAMGKVGCLLSSFFASPTPNAYEAAKKTAVVLFTSGSEGTPKPVALSHLNIQANTAQVRCALDFFATDVMMDLMPMFHSFGLCTGTIMPLSAGMPIAFYPTPLHYKKIPQYAYETKSTVLLGTNAFLAGYAKNADEFDFFEIKYVICGGDKLKESTARLWMEKFGKRVLEGYGVTECSPVVGVNRPGYVKFGSIGRPLPCVRPSISPVEGVARGGRLVLKGPNLMTGYIQADGSILQPSAEGYDTGDIVTIDDDGFITIEGRARRFAKIGGEMVSLAQIEAAVQEVWPEETHAVVSVPDENRGEVIVLLTERPSPDREELRAGLAATGMPELVIPKRIIRAAPIPRIGVGKIDYESALKLAKEDKQ